MASQPDTNATPRIPLTRDRVLRTAIRIADEKGLEALTMRKLGQELGVQAMSLYNHVASKDDLHEGIVDIVMSEIEVPATGEDWKAALRRSALSAHETFLRHPWACSLHMSMARVNDARMLWMEGVLKTLREAGFSPNMTHHAYHALDSHITGFTLWLVSMPFDSREELVDMASAFIPQIAADKYPYVIEHAKEHLEEPDPDEPSEFEFGLDLILDGLERISSMEKPISEPD
jgi:AcrR family transcriptional regulator